MNTMNDAVTPSRNLGGSPVDIRTNTQQDGHHVVIRSEFAAERRDSSRGKTDGCPVSRAVENISAPGTDYSPDLPRGSISASRNERFDVGCGSHAGEARDLFASTKQRECGDGENTETFAKLRETVCVHFDHERLARHAARRGLELRRHHAAGPAPRRPEVDQNWNWRGLKDRVESGDVRRFDRLGRWRQRRVTVAASDRAVEIRIAQAVGLAA